MFDAIIVMAGSGKRFGSDVNKVFHQVRGKEIFLHSLEPFLGFDDLHEVILVVNPKEIEQVREICKRQGLCCQVVAGGTTRPESVRNGLSVATCSKILIHDGARPLITTTDIRKVLDALETEVAVTLVNPVYDTLKVVDGHYLSHTLDRNLIKKVITPQGIRNDIIKYLMHPNIPDELITDEMVVLEGKVKVAVVESDTPNIKLTTRNDLEFITYYLEKEGR